MPFLASGEWWEATLFMACSFVAAAVGAVGLGWWVLRGDRLNRAASLDSAATSEPPAH